MIEQEESGMRWLEFELLADSGGVIQRIYTRQGGSSSGTYASLNYSLNVGDCKEAVMANRQQIAASLPQLSHILLPLIDHGVEVAVINDPSQLVAAKCDGCATQLPYVGLVVTHADCQAALFYDPITHAAAAIHCGWKGNVQNIYAATVTLMQQQFGTRPENLLVGISPSLGPESSEFVNYTEELPEHFWCYAIRPHHFNLWAISKQQLVDAGLLPHHIEIAGIDTYTNKDFFSHRRERPTGRNATLIALT